MMTARQGGPDNLRGIPLTCANHNVPPRGYTPEGYEGGDASSSRLTTRTSRRSLWRKNDSRRTHLLTAGNSPGGRMSNTQRAAVPEIRHADDELLTLEEVAVVVRVPVATLRYWRHLGTGPRSFRIGRSVRYWRTEVFAWLDDQANSDRQSAV